MALATEVCVAIDAPPDRVWSVLADVSRWHEWTDSIARVEVLDGDVLAPGVRTRIRQPGLPAVTWRVTEVEANRGFTWENRSLAFSTTAGHHVAPRGDHGEGSTLTLTMRRTGPLGWVISRFVRDVELTYVTMEAYGLKQRAEALERASRAGAPVA